MYEFTAAIVPCKFIGDAAVLFARPPHSSRSDLACSVKLTRRPCARAACEKVASALVLDV